MVPDSNIIGTVFQSFGHRFVSHTQATTYWQCVRCAEQAVPADKKLLRMNLDETSVSMAPDLNAGLIVARSAPSARAPVCRHESRTNVTYVALICDSPVVQSTLPHFIIGSKAQITKANCEKLRRSSRPGTHVIRNEHKAWNNSMVMQRILKIVSDVLPDDVQPVLILDVAPCHIAETVMKKARALGIWLVYVPAQITFLLQPLDTHAFASFKAWLRQQYAALQSKAEGGLVCRLRWLQVLQTAKREFFDARTWAHSFQDTGARRPIVRFTQALQKYAEPQDARDASGRPVSEQGMQIIWPRRRRMLYAHALLYPLPARPAARLHSAEPKPVKRLMPAEFVSVALSSRANKRACRQML